MAPQRKYSKLSAARVLLIGGTAGVGFAAAEACLEAGATVIVSGSNDERLASAVEKLKEAYPEAASSSGRILGKTCDLSDASKIEANLKALLEFASEGGKIDHIVFSAGDAPQIPPLAAYTPSSEKSVGLVIRQEGSIALGKLAPAYMNPGPRSSITLTGASSSVKPPAGIGYFAGFAAGFEGLARGLAVELAPIRVNLVSLGVVDTGLLRTLVGYRGGDVDQMLAAFAQLTLVGKIGAVEDVAEAYVYFMKDSSVTGQVIRTDGGWILK